DLRPRHRRAAPAAREPPAAGGADARGHGRQRRVLLRDPPFAGPRAATAVVEDELRAGDRGVPAVRPLGPGGPGALAQGGPGAGGGSPARAPDPAGHGGAAEPRGGGRRGRALRRHPLRTRPYRPQRRPLADRHRHLARGARRRPARGARGDDQALPRRGGLGRPGPRLAGPGTAAGLIAEAPPAASHTTADAPTPIRTDPRRPHGGPSSHKPVRCGAWLFPPPPPRTRAAPARRPPAPPRTAPHASR